MSHVYGDSFSKNIQRSAYCNYLKARFSRLYPLHFFVLLYLVTITSLVWIQLDINELPIAAQIVLDPSAILPNIFLIQAWGTHAEATWNTPAWSISTEFFLYLVFPFITIFIHTYKRKAKVVLLIATIGGVLLLTYYFKPYMQLVLTELRQRDPSTLKLQNNINVTTGPTLLRGICGFVIGMITYELYVKNWQRKILENSTRFFAITVSTLLLWMENLLPDIIALFIFAILILHISYAQGITKRILNNPVFIYLGDISYSIYMVHIPIMFTFFIANIYSHAVTYGASEKTYAVTYANSWQVENPWQGLLIVAILVLVVASLSYRYIELPIRKNLKIKFINKHTEHPLTDDSGALFIRRAEKNGI